MVNSGNQGRRGAGGTHAHADVDNAKENLRSKRVAFGGVMSADSNSDNGGKAPLSGRGIGSSSEGDQPDFNSTKNLRTGTYQKRGDSRPT